MQTDTSYQVLLERSQRINWRIEDVIGGDKRLDFSKPFLPETYARATQLPFLSPRERLMLNHIRAHGYLAMFGLVEEFILPFVVDQTRERLNGDDYQTRALLQFAGEEAKHIQLFKTFRADFEEGFGTHCDFIGPAEEISRAILNHHPLAVAIAVLGIEWMSQGHYLESVRDDHDLDPQFTSMLKHHWQEEAQHAKLDGLLMASIAEGLTPGQIDRAVDEYFEIGGFVDGGLKQQTLFDLDALERASRRKFSEAERERFIAVQHQAQRWTFLGSAMRNENFLGALGELGGSARARVEGAAEGLC